MTRIYILRILLLLAFFVTRNPLQAQFKMEESHKHKFYFYWGYNREWFSKSSIHFNGPHYDFTLHNLKAKDRQTKLDWLYLNPETLSIPQYNFRLGYYLTDRFSVSAGMDHMKYVVVANQKTTISGTIDSIASPQYAGNYSNDSITMTTDLLQFEHTNGFNYATLDAEYNLPLFRFWKNRISVNWNVGVGGFFVITKTDVKVLNDGLDNEFHLSGLAMSAKTGLRFEFWNRFFFTSELKAGYAVLPWVPIKNKSAEGANHRVGFLEYYGAIGYQFKLFDKKKKEKK